MARPRSVPEEEALERALQVFWSQGYEDASIADLSEAIGVGPSSVYNAFGSKAELYRRALQHYLTTHGRVLMEVFAEAPEVGAPESLRRLLRHAAELFTRPDLPHGCAIMQSSGNSSPESTEACAITHAFKTELAEQLRLLFDRSARAGDELAATPRTLATFVAGTIRGLSQLACDGAKRRELIKVAEHAARSCFLDA